MSETVHASEEDLVLYYYGEKTSGAYAREGRLKQHLQQCEACETAFQNLVRLLEACHEVPVPEPHASFEARIWNRLEPQLHPLGRRRGLFDIFSMRAVAATACLVLLVGGAFLAGRFLAPAHQPKPDVTAMSEAGRERLLLLALGDHLERSQMVLTDVANAPENTSGVQRERVRNLLSENRLYRQTAADSDDPAVGQVLDELERVLLDLSHGADGGEIRSRIEAEGLLFKLRVLGANIQHTNDSAPARKPGRHEEKL